ncbi:AAA family ATPase [Microbacterium sp. KUDC0406]|uniref:HelD family protein n=1 Tax=Microbacterium sp. KUDC0406 TaxID=2909588 RepID=UPI001F19FFD0|nr:AAA family ATPase [Microbacterium sp. KUDC0406]UJP09746.1 AAA family ATPase [Microbacterium sp. KUDC0406]
MDAGVGTARQVEHEQNTIDEMYRLLDEGVSSGLAAQARVMAAEVEGPADLFARDAELARLSDGVRRLRGAEHALCFGRIDDANGASLHIGRIGLTSPDGEALLVDWRAEAARPFYAATMTSPLGLRRRRHLRLDGRRVSDVTDEILDGTTPTADDLVGDGPLLSALSGARTGRMREAASTLQAEQDEIVRSPHRGIMVVDGGPGTGKTIVALHRAAYVLYAFPAIAERGVLVFGPNRRFLTYISEVLPSLGENDVQLATASDLIGADATAQDLERVARLKGGAAFADALARWVQDRQPQGRSLTLQTAHGTVVLDATRVDAARRGALQGDAAHNRARELFLEYVVEDLVDELEQQTAREVTEFEEEIRDVLGIDLDGMFAEDGDGESDGELEIDWDRIRDELLVDPGVDRIVEGVWPRLRPEQVVRGLLSDHAALERMLPAEDVAALAAAPSTGWSDADLVLLDEARALVDGPPDAVWGHIVVDEAQLLSEMQWRMLLRRCPSRSMTVVGDLAQAGPATTVRSWYEALRPFGADRFAHHTLTVNYRTTAEILQASEPALARIAPAQRLSRSIRHGDRPTRIVVDAGELTAALDDLVAELRDSHPAEQIGVIAAAHRAAELDAGIHDASIVPASDARGLEFDTVILLEPEEIESAGEAGIRDLYVAQTRATKRLFTLVTG